MQSELRGSECGYSIIELDGRYIDQIVSIHAEALSDDVLPNLGNDFLNRYYQYVLMEKSQLLIGAFANGSLLGFCQLSFSSIGVISVFRKYPWLVFKVMTLALVKSRIFFRGVLLALDRMGAIASLPEISFIAVRKSMQGKGIGKRLVIVANNLAAARGVSRITTKTENKIARILYEKSFGARLTRTRNVLGREYWYLSWKTSEKKP